MNDKEQITKLTRELERLRVTAQQLENRTRRLESENQVLSNHIRTLQADTAAPQASQPRARRVGDRIRIKKPTCPGRSRSVMPSDGIGTITRISGDWIYYTSDSGLHAKRFPCNIGPLEQS